MIAGNFWENYQRNPFLLIEEKAVVTIEEMEALMEKFGVKIMFACDLYVNGIEKYGMLMEYGFEYVRNGRRIVNIDHHAPILQFERSISSTNLALLYLQRFGTADRKALVVVNHTDADAILSASLVAGVFGMIRKPESRTARKLLENLQFLGRVAIIADHTGEVDGVADLLQAHKFERDVEGPLRNLQLFFEGKALLPRAQALLDIRLAERRRAQELVGAGRFKQCGHITYAVLEENVDMAFLPALLPKAIVILTCIPSRRNPEKHIVRYRLGKRGEGLIALNKLGLDLFVDPGCKGRHNAGSNRRYGGSSIPLKAYLIGINERIGFRLSRNLN